MSEMNKGDTGMITEQELEEMIGDNICDGCPMLTPCLHSDNSLCDIDETIDKIISLIKQHYCLKPIKE